MSVSFIVPVWREDTYAEVALDWLQKQVSWFGAELIEVRKSRSIFEALERGRRKAKNRFLFYVHDDVRLLKPYDLVPQIVKAFSTLPNLGLIGPVGKVNTEKVPWWMNTGPYVGHYCRRGPRRGIVYQYAKRNGTSHHRDVDGPAAITDPRWNRFAKAGLVDGFFLCEDRERLADKWDLHSFGNNWHAYDMDRCFQTHALGLDVMVPHWLFLHDNAGHSGYKGTKRVEFKRKDELRRVVKSPGDKLWLSDLEVANNVLRTKWNLP